MPHLRGKPPQAPHRGTGTPISMYFVLPELHASRNVMAKLDKIAVALRTSNDNEVLCMPQNVRLKISRHPANGLLKVLIPSGKAS
jgi:hypothetical protein